MLHVFLQQFREPTTIIYPFTEIAVAYRKGVYSKMVSIRHGRHDLKVL